MDTHTLFGKFKEHKMELKKLSTYKEREKKRKKEKKFIMQRWGIQLWWWDVSHSEELQNIPNKLKETKRGTIKIWGESLVHQNMLHMLKERAHQATLSLS